MKWKRVGTYGLMILLLIVSISNVSLAHGDDSDDPEEDEGNTWIGHAFLALLSFIAISFMFYLGAITRGSVKTPEYFKKINIKKSYNISTFILFIVLLATYLYGLWITTSHGEEVMGSMHGFVGFTLVILSGSNALLNTFKANFTKSILNPVLGILMLLILVIQVILGVLNII